ncbi:MATE family efflux transporter [Fulvivirga sedimenti]|uniref:Multidrug-efflux transporter n=1 Tax=Fulvivirga sedimenti TaxID=2879465 RepID=A0A9X1HX43_9BACT|nr:MATE family efflux transporter [Fulvivirga sedimenti]MCA6078037.1 MATE family efflux transporter [Fulvivirga sedimenti]
MHQNYREHIKKNFLLAYPVMLSQLGHMMVSVADSVMVGQLGATPLAAASLANVIFTIVLMFGIGVSYGVTPLVAAADGEGDHQRSAQLLKHAFVINLLTGILLFLIIILASPGLYLLDQPADVVELGIPYLGIITFSIIPLMLFQSGRQFAEGLSRTKMAMVIVIVSNLFNVALNYLLIYGKLGFPALGLNGAGWASLLSRIILAAWMIAYLYYGKKFKRYRAGFQIGEYSRYFIRRITNIGIPAGFQYIFEVGAFGFAVIMMGWLGTKSLAAHQIAVNLAAVTYMAASGLSAAATIRVGNQWGKKDIPTLRAAAFSIYGMVIVFMSFTAIIFITARYFLPSLYIHDEEVISIASTLLIIAGFFQLSDGIQVVSLGALRGLEDVKIPTLVTFFAYWVVALPTGYLLAFRFNMGPTGIWIGLLSGLTLTAIFLFFRFNRITARMMPEKSEIANLAE